MEFNKKAIFVTGTDTNVGKTFICALLLGFLRDNGVDAGYQKWVSTGGEEPEDLQFCMEKTEQNYNQQDIEKQVPYRFLLPASPHLAAEQEKRKIDPDLLKQRFHNYAGEKELLVVEGVGGLMVPLCRDLLLADFLTGFKMPTVIVARSGLGTLNHTLLTIEALQNRQIPILGVIFSDEDKDLAKDDLVVNDNMKTIGDISKVTVFGRILRYSEFRDARKAFQSIGTAVVSSLQAK